jgi:hypothetical protein
MVMGGIVFLGMLPMISASGVQHDGLAAYARRWETNASVYAVVRYALGLVNLEADKTQLDARTMSGQEKFELPSRSTVTRAVVGALLLALLIRIAREPGKDAAVDVGKAFAAVAAVQLFSPVFLPWYATWFVPFLAVFPLRSFLYLSLSTPLGWYGAHAFDGYASFVEIRRLLQFLEYAPFYVMLALEWRRTVRQPSAEHQATGTA